MSLVLAIFGFLSPLALSAAEGDLLSAQARESFGSVVFKAAGVCGWLTVALSCAGGAVAFYLLFHLRRDRWAPGPVVEEFGKLMAKGRKQEAWVLCEADGSFFAQVAAAGLRNFDVGRDGMERSMQAAAEERLAPWHQKVSWLNLIATVAPMMGLLGTVIGMIETFGAIKGLGPDMRKEDLAGGIEYALVTTYIGLMVAIPHLMLYFLLRGRLDSLSQEAAGHLQQSLLERAPLK